MKKENILEEKLNIIEWCQTLKEVPDDIWFQSFKNGSWGIADVISHFIIWDDFVMKYRIPADNFYNDFQIGTKKVMLNHYFSSLIQRDLKHKEEIIQFLIHNQV